MLCSTLELLRFYTGGVAFVERIINKGCDSRMTPKTVKHSTKSRDSKSTTCIIWYVNLEKHVYLLCSVLKTEQNERKKEGKC